MTSKVRCLSLLYPAPLRVPVKDTPRDRNDVTLRAGEAGADMADELRSELSRSANRKVEYRLQFGQHFIWIW